MFKQSLRKDYKINILALSIKFFNKEADIPYTYCFYAGKKYLISVDSGYYSKCIYSKKSCNRTYIVLSRKLSSFCSNYIFLY